MTIHFAAARPAANARLVRWFASGRPARAANDNVTGQSDAENSALLRAALLHFARYRLGAAEIARTAAERAFFAGDREGQAHWLGVCRILDRRMAQSAAFHRSGDCPR